MYENDSLTGIRAQLARIERKLDIAADTIFSVVTVGGFILASLAIRSLHLSAPFDWIVPPIAFLVIVIAVGSLRQNYGKWV